MGPVIAPMTPRNPSPNKDTKSKITAIFGLGFRDVLGANPRPIPLLACLSWTIKKLSEYDQEIPQSHTADQPIAPRGIATEHL